MDSEEIRRSRDEPRRPEDVEPRRPLRLRPEELLEESSLKPKRAKEKNISRNEFHAFPRALEDKYWTLYYV